MMKERMLRWIRDAGEVRVWVLVFGAVALLYVPFSRLGVDTHHDGIMLYPALRVAEGAVVHGDVFNQYGPVSTWIQALWILLLGPTLWAIRVGTALMLAAGMATFHVAWRRVLGRGVAVTATLVAVLLTPFFSPNYPMHPWSSDVALVLIGIVALLLSLPAAAVARPVPWTTVGALVSAISLTRANAGAVLGLLLFVWLAGRREWQRLWRLVLGAVLFSGAVLTYLGFNGALGDWWYQTYEIPRKWLVDGSGIAGADFIKGNLLRTAAPGLLLVLAASITIGGRLEAKVTVSRRRSLRAVLLLTGLLIAIVYHRGWQMPGWNRFSALWTVLLLVALAGPWLVGWFDVNRPTPSPEGGRKFWIWAVAMAGAIQIYPVAGARHLWWAAVPALGPAIWMLGRQAVSDGRRVALAVVAVMLLVPLAVQDGWQTLQKDRVSLPDTSVLDGMLMTSTQAGYFSDHLASVSAYLEAHDDPPILNMCNDGLFAAISTNRESPDPYFVYWPYPRDAYDHGARGRFIDEERPILWWCPPAPDPTMLARGYGMRLLVPDPDLPDGLRWPNLSRVAVPAEWSPLPGERQVAVDFEFEIPDSLSKALAAGLLEEVRGATVVVAGAGDWAPPNPRKMEGLRGTSEVRFVAQPMNDWTACNNLADLDDVELTAREVGARWCTGDGRTVGWMGRIVTEDSEFYFAVPIIRFERYWATDYSVLVDVSGMRTFGPAESTPLCDFQITVDDPLSAVIGAVGDTLRVCSSGPESDLADVTLWLSEGCRDRPGWWLCSSAIDPLVGDLLQAALVKGFFDEVEEPSVLVVLGRDRMVDVGRFVLADAVGFERFHVVDALPAEVENCGETSVCDAEGRPIHIIQLVDRDGGPMLVRMPLAMVGENLDQAIAMVNQVRMFGRSDVVSSCDIDGPGERGDAIEGDWLSRSCKTVVPVQRSLYLSWARDGCDGRSGWWLCQPVLSDEVRDLVSTALDEGLFDHLVGGVVVPATPERWRDAGVDHLQSLLSSADIVVASSVPGESASCGPVSVCDPQGRPIYAIELVDRNGGTFIVMAQVAMLGENLDQAAVMVNTTKMIGSADHLPNCEINGDPITASTVNADWVVRTCSPVVPTQFSTFLSWARDGCVERPGWWLCP